jgi:battenin
MTAEKPNRVRLIDRAAMFILGVINNTPYVIGIASAEAIVKTFDVPGSMGIVLAADTVSGVFSRFLNSWLVSLHISYEILYGANCAMLLFGLLSCAFSRWFWLECVGIFFIGFSSNVGETIILCYMSHRHKQVLLKSWGSGTGMAGIIGAGYSLICVWAKVSNFWSFIGVSPVVVVYALVFYLIIARSPDEDFAGLESQFFSLPGKPATVGACDCSYFGYNGFIMFNCGIIYFLEYVMQTLFADNSLTGDQKKRFHFFYPLLNLSYQIGVFMSRSSLSFFEFPRVWILTLCQCTFFVLWLCQAVFHFMPLYIMWLPMVVVGLFGGCGYVNSFHLMMNDASLTVMQKEMITSYNSFFIAVFIFLSTLTTLIAENTFMVPEQPSE